MSVFEPHIDPEPGATSPPPPLDVPLRGRKGQQVTAYIQDLASRIDQERDRAGMAERAAAHLQHELDVLRNQPPPSFEHLGSEAAKVLEEAGRSAKVLVEEAKERGKDLVREAEKVADRVRARAERDATTRLDAARQAAEQMIAKANGERSATEEETRRLRQYRDSLLVHLGRVQSDLAGFLAGTSDPPPAPGQQATQAPGQQATQAPGQQAMQAPGQEAAAVPPGRPAGAEVGSRPGPAARELAPPSLATRGPAAEPAREDPAAEPARGDAAGAPEHDRPAESAIAAARAPK